MLGYIGSENNFVAVDKLGSKADQPVILMHGGGQTRHSWKDAASIISSRGYYVISVDMRGHGDSDWVASKDYSLKQAASDILLIIQQLSQPPILIGASYGGLVSVYIAGIMREAIKAMVLVDVVPKINPEGVKPIRDFMRSNPDGFESIEDAAVAVATYLPHRKKPSDLEGLKKNLRLKGGRYFWHWDPALMESTETEKIYADFSVFTDPIDVPAVLLRAGLSAVVDEEGVRDLKALIPSLTDVDVAQAGHMIAGDTNNDFQDAVFDFLKNL